MDRIRVKFEERGALDAPCHNHTFYRSRCRSPRACTDFGHCRNRGVQSIETRKHERRTAENQRIQAITFRDATPHQQPTMWRHLVCLWVVMEEWYPS